MYVYHKKYTVQVICLTNLGLKGTFRKETKNLKSYLMKLKLSKYLMKLYLKKYLIKLNLKKIPH